MAFQNNIVIKSKKADEFFICFFTEIMSFFLDTYSGVC